VKSFTRKPATAGKPFTVSLVVARSDSGALLRSGRVTCAATVGGQRLAARTHAVVNKQVTCTWIIPASARGKTIAGSIAVAFEDKSVTRRFSARVG
jgi:hypothetical protein